MWLSAKVIFSDLFNFIPIYFKCVFFFIGQIFFYCLLFSEIFLHLINNKWQKIRKRLRIAIKRSKKSSNKGKKYNLQEIPNSNKTWIHPNQVQWTPKLLKRRSDTVTDKQHRDHHFILLRRLQAKHSEIPTFIIGHVTAQEEMSEVTFQIDSPAMDYLAPSPRKPAKKRHLFPHAIKSTAYINSYLYLNMQPFFLH